MEAYEITFQLSERDQWPGRCLQTVNDQEIQAMGHVPNIVLSALQNTSLESFLQCCTVQPAFREGDVQRNELRSIYSEQ